MKRWDFSEMMQIGCKLFASIHRRKRYANPNHDVHLMARNLGEWLTEGIQSLIHGTYNPRFLKRIYFQDEVRHEVAIQTVAAECHLKATYCSVSSSLPEHATGVIRWFEASGTM